MRRRPITRSSPFSAPKRVDGRVDGPRVVPSAKTRPNGGCGASLETFDVAAAVGVYLSAPATPEEMGPGAPLWDDRAVHMTARRPKRMRPASLLALRGRLGSARQEQEQNGGATRKGNRRPPHGSTVALRSMEAA